MTGLEIAGLFGIFLFGFIVGFRFALCLFIVANAWCDAVVAGPILSRGLDVAGDGAGCGSLGRCNSGGSMKDYVKGLIGRRVAEAVVTTALELAFRAYRQWRGRR